MFKWHNGIFPCRNMLTDATSRFTIVSPLVLPRFPICEVNPCPAI